MYTLIKYTDRSMISLCLRHLRKIALLVMNKCILVFKNFINICKSINLYAQVTLKIADYHPHISHINPSLLSVCMPYTISERCIYLYRYQDIYAVSRETLQSLSQLSYIMILHEST